MLASFKATSNPGIDKNFEENKYFKRYIYRTFRKLQNESLDFHEKNIIVVK